MDEHIFQKAKHEMRKEVYYFLSILKKDAMSGLHEENLPEGILLLKYHLLLVMVKISTVIVLD